MMHHLFRNALVALILCAPLSSQAAELFFSPKAGSVSTNEQFDVVVAVQSDVPVTATEATLSFNPAALQVVGIDTAGSILVTWPTEPLFSNERGIIQFSGSADAPYLGTEGRILTVRFRAMSNGAHQLRIDDAVALGPGGSNVISTLESGIYTVEPSSLPVEQSAEPIAIIQEAPTSVPVPLLEQGVDLEVGDRLVVRGLVIPGVLVHISVSEGDAEARTFTVPSAGDGSFTYVSDFRVSEGVYRVSAITEGKGVKSEPSATVSFSVRPLGLAAAAATAIDVLTFIIPLIALTALLGGIIAYVVYRRRR